MAGQERRTDEPYNSRTPLPHATTFGQERFTFADIQGIRGACGHQIIAEDDATSCISSLQPLE
jgi:hypothetical protein